MTTETPLALAIDVGTSSCRAGLYDAAGQHVAGTAAQIVYAPALIRDGGAELSPDVLLDQVASAIDATVRQTGDAALRIVAVGTSVFWHSLMGVDAEGRAITPIYPWMDARSRAEAAWLRTHLDERAVHARTGCPLHWTYWPAKLRWLRTMDPDLFGSVRRWISFGEYLTRQLTGQTTVSLSMASGTGLVDQHTCQWDDEILGALDLDPSRLSPIAREAPETPAAGVGAPRLRSPYSERWPMLRGIPWLPAFGDGACSNVGAGCATRERAALMIGTSGAMRVLWRADAVEIPWGAWCYRLDHSHVVLGGALNDGGSLHAWMRDTLRLPDLADEDAATAALPPDGHGLTIFPAWAGERSPGWSDDARGAIVGLRLSTTPAEILRAALEAVALRFGAIDALIRGTVPESVEVIATGGALLHSSTWLQIMADVLGRPVKASAELEASSRGAALLALDAVGAIPEGIESLTPEVARVFQPVPENVAIYRAAARRQEQLYRALVGMSHV